MRQETTTTTDDACEALDTVDGLLLVDQNRSRGSLGKEYLGITVASIAAEVVAPPSFAQEYRAKSSQGSRSAAKYRMASGSAIMNQSEKRVTLQA